jgi:hypothetical protein
MKTIESFLPVFDGTYGTIFEDIDFDQKDEVGRQLTNVINEYICELGITATYQDFISPRFYNFANDSIDVKYSYDSLDVLKQWIADNIDDVQHELNSRYTSCDGFISHHSTDLYDWIDNMEDDKHKLGAMLDIYVGIQYDRNDAVMDMYYKLSDNGLLIYEDDETV